MSRGQYQKQQARKQWPTGKVAFLFSIIGVYLLIAAALIYLVSQGVIERTVVPVDDERGTDNVQTRSTSILDNLIAAQHFTQRTFVEENGHVNLYVAVKDIANLQKVATGQQDVDAVILEKYAGLVGNATATGSDTINDYNTNSEAASYYLLWTAQAYEKEKFDTQLDFIRTHMLHPDHGYMMWRLTANDTVEGDGENIASDADLRVIKALLIANEQWPSPEYEQMIDGLAASLEKVAITDDLYLAPYGGSSGPDATWTADEVWLSYADFTVFDALSMRRGEPWTTVNENMKQAVLDAQLDNGLYNSMLTPNRQYGSGIDGAGYSINSLWIMVRSAESDDAQLRESANRSLQFYKDKFFIDAQLYAEYGSNGDALSPSDTPWVYALVGRAAVALDDQEFAGHMMRKLVEKQVTDENSSLYGALIEGYGNDARVGQFTMQESILTMQDFLASENVSASQMLLERRTAQGIPGDGVENT